MASFVLFCSFHHRQWRCIVCCCLCKSWTYWVVRASSSNFDFYNFPHPFSMDSIRMERLLRIKFEYFLFIKKKSLFSNDHILAKVIYHIQIGTKAIVYSLPFSSLYCAVDTNILTLYIQWFWKIKKKRRTFSFALWWFFKWPFSKLTMQKRKANKKRDKIHFYSDHHHDNWANHVIFQSFFLSCMLYAWCLE